MANELVLEGGVWKFRVLQGVADVQFDVNPNYGDTFVLNSEESSITLRLTNSDSAPAAISLSFGNNALKVTSFDTGTETNPSYVINGGSYRDVDVIRGAGAPTPGAPNSGTINCTISYTLADGTVSEKTDYIEVKNAIFDDFSLGVRSIAIPTQEYKFEGNFNNTGTGDTPSSGTTFRFETVSDSTDRAKFVGYTHTPNPSTNARVERTLDVGEWIAGSGQSRSWIFAWSNTAQLNNGRNLTDFYDNESIAYGALGSTTANMTFAKDGTIINLNSTHSHCTVDSSGTPTITTSASETLLSSTNDLSLIAVSWDGSGTFTYRWKQVGHGAGFSFKEVTGQTADTDSGDQTIQIVGDNGDCVYGDFRMRNLSIIDHELTHAEFNLLSLVAFDI